MTIFMFIADTSSVVVSVVGGGVYVPVFTVVPAGDIDTVTAGTFPFIWQRTADTVSLRGSVEIVWLNAGAGAFDFTLPVPPGAPLVNLTGSIAIEPQVGAPALSTLWRFLVIGGAGNVEARAGINSSDGATGEWLIELSYELP